MEGFVIVMSVPMSGNSNLGLAETIKALIYAAAVSFSPAPLCHRHASTEASVDNF